MRFFAWFFFLLVLGLVGFLAIKIRGNTGGDPELLMAEARRLSGGAEPDIPAAIDKLNFALRIAQEDPLANHAQIGTVLAARGGLFGEIGQYAQARIDLERVLEDYRPGDLDVQIDLASVLLETEELRGALELTEAVLAADPRRADGWTLQSRALVALADEIRGEAIEICEDALPDQKEAQAEEALDRITSLELDSPQRVSWLYKLRSLFEFREDARLRDVLRLSEQASDYVAEARTALAESFRDRPSQAALLDFQSLLRRAGRRDLAIAFGLAAINYREANANIAFVRALLEDLLAEDRPHTGVDVINQYFARDVIPDAGFYRVWCATLYRDERWSSLVFVAQSSLNAATSDQERAEANLYLGLAHANQQQFFEAPGPLIKFTGSSAYDPFPGARVTANLALANCHRELRQDAPEKSALRGALKEMADDHPEAGASWLRLAELVRITEPGSGKEAFEALTHGVRLSPERVEELYPVWRSQGEQRLVQARANLNLVYQALVAGGQLVPEGQVEPYELLRLAEMYAADRRTSGVAGCCRKFLLRYPGFLPVLEMYIATAREVDDADLLARLLIERVKTAGVDRAALDELAVLPTNLLTLATRTELMRLDPEHTGRLALVRDLQARGRAFDALSGLNLLPAEELNEEGHLLKAELALELERWGMAEEALAGIAEGSPQYGRALEFQLDVAVATSKREELDGLIAKVAERPEADVELLVGIARRMLLRSLPSFAQSLLEKLDARPDARSGEVMFELALAAWRNGDLDAATEHLARAQAYQTDGAPELGWLIQAVDERRWSDLPWLVADLQATEFKPTLLQGAILDLLREEPESAAEIVARGAEEHPEEPLWGVLERVLDLMRSPNTQAAPVDPIDPLDPIDIEGGDDLLYLLAGAGGGDRDPRQLLVRLLALDHPSWLVWATAEFEANPIPDQGSLWSTYLAGRGRERLDDLERAEVHANEIIEASKGFVPAWDLLERVTLAGVDRPDHPRYQRVLLKRKRTLDEGGQPASAGSQEKGAHRRRELEPADLRTAARAMDEEGDLEAALGYLEEALALDPDDPETLLYLAQLRHRRLEWLEAIDGYGAVLAEREVEAGDYVLLEYLTLLEEVRKAAPELLSTVHEEVEHLVLRFPEDPLVALARARRELELGPPVPEVRLGRALQRLDEFRVATEYKSLESLLPESTRAWFAFYLEHDPDAAHKLVAAELEKEPAAVDLWYMLGESYAALGQKSDAVETFRFLLRMLPDKRTTRSLARLLSQSGRGIEEVSELVSQTMHLERSRSKDIDLQLSVARSLANNLASESRDRALAMLQDLWNKQRSEGRGEAEVAEIGELYGLCLVWRFQGGPVEQVLLEVDELLDDPARRHMLRAVANLAP